MNVAVLGGGHGGYATAADLALAGHAVSLWRRSPDDLAAVRGAGGITLAGEDRHGNASLARVTADIAEAVAGADVVVAALPATAHEDLARRLAPHVGERHVVLLTPGTLGSYVLAREIARAGGQLPYAIAETGTRPYLARKAGPADVRVCVRAAHLPTGVFPASRASAALARIGEVFPSVRPCVDALDAALTNPGPVLHPPFVLLTAGAAEPGSFDLRGAEPAPSTRRIMEAVDAERVAARTGWGYPAPHYELAKSDGKTTVLDALYGAGAGAKLAASGRTSEPLTLDHRVVAEDVTLGLALLESAARTVGVNSPATAGLLLVFGTLLGRTLSGRGRALEHLGLGDVVLREIRALLYEGWMSPLWGRLIK